jgi:hypothetical protein
MFALFDADALQKYRTITFKMKAPLHNAAVLFQ